jgi:hypothetical protein
LRWDVPVPEPRSYTVSFSDSARSRHSVVVTAATLYEAVALGLRAFREQSLLVECQLGTATQITVEVRAPTRTAAVERWINAVGRGPKEQLAKGRVRDLLAGK